MAAFQGLFVTSLEHALSESLKQMKMTSLKDKQKEAILSFVEGNDTFVSLPTGYGKSVIYGILPMLFDQLLGESLYTLIPKATRVQLFNILAGDWGHPIRFVWQHCTLCKPSDRSHDGSESKVIVICDRPGITEAPLPYRMIAGSMQQSLVTRHPW